MEFITADEARKAYIESQPSDQLTKLDQIIRKVMKYRKKITLYYTSDCSDKYYETLLPFYAQMLRRTKNIYPEFKGVIEPDVKAKMKEAGHTIDETWVTEHGMKIIKVVISWE